MAERFFARRPVLMGTVVIVVVALSVSIPAVRSGLQKALGSLRMQKVQAVNVDFSPFVDANANPSLHQMVTQMISDKVQVLVNENDQPVSDAAEASKVAGFHAQLVTARKDSPKLVVGGEHKLDVTVDRARLQAIANEAGHTELTLPSSIDGASLDVQIPRSVNAQYGTCPGPSTATDAIASNITGPTPTTTQFSDCLRLREGPSPIINIPAGLDVANLAQIGLETGGMSPTQARDFLQTIDWKATLTMTVPRFLRSYEEVKIGGTRGTLLSMAGRRGPGYMLVWAKDGIAYTLTGFGDSSQAVGLANSIK
ncbi:MAG TPA: hypothetical protein VGT24_08660 [Candidatus Acidoferrales bacterium]|nr:hypothetical protein [Candidatus Acidoferrales bacterium]